MNTHDIKRYAVSGDIAYPVCEDPEGDYVTYEDHVAAIEADRQRTAELLQNPVHVHTNMCRGIIAPITFDMLAHVLGEEATQTWLNDRQRRGEPVAWLYEDELPDNYPYEAMFPYSKVDGVRMFPVYVPQPAEPSSHSIQDCPEDDKWNCKYCKRVNKCPVVGQRDAQPATPVVKESLTVAESMKGQTGKTVLQSNQSLNTPVEKKDWNVELSSWSDEDFVQVFHECPDLADRLRRVLAEPVKCPDPSMGEHACSNRAQCWEPCGELGSSIEHAKVAQPVKVQHVDDINVADIPAVSAEHATLNLQPSSSMQPVATAFFTEKGEVAFTGLFDRTLKALEAVKTTRMGISSGSIDLYAAPQAAEHSKGEPVAWIHRSYLNLIRESNVALHNVVVRGSILDGDGDVVPLFTAPQLAEPVSAPKHLIERLQKHSEDKSNTAFARSTMREALQYLTAEPVDTDLVQRWQREHGVVLTPGTREAAMVVIRHDEDGKPTVWCDPEIADLVRALNDGGVATVASCSGHGYRPGNIMLADGRVLVVCKDADEAREVESHFPGINGEAPLAAEPVKVPSDLPVTEQEEEAWQRMEAKG